MFVFVTFDFLIQIGTQESRLIEHFLVKRWKETEFLIDPISLLHLQFIVAQKERDERINSNIPTAIGIHA